MIAALSKYARHFAGAFHTNCRIVDAVDRAFVGEIAGKATYFGSFCGNAGCDLLNTYLYGCSEAYRWGGKYIYYCHEGFVFIASSVSDDAGALAGGIVLGPIVMGEFSDMLADYEGRSGAEKLAELSNLTTGTVNDIAEILAAVTAQISGVPHSLMGTVSFRQEDILQELYSQKARYENANIAYPIETEKRLQTVIRNGDKQGAQAILNELLGKIYLIENFDIEDIKIRLIELLTVLSRATIDAGADSNEILWFNTSCIREMQKCRTIDELSVWITGILHKFIRYSFDFSSVKHSDTVYKVIEYIRLHYAEKVTLNEIAQYVSFSKTYLSRIFKLETGENISSYINKVRIEKAKLLLADKNANLADIANAVGFEDQSYFTKVFKSVTGVQPKKYKEMRMKR